MRHRARSVRASSSLAVVVVAAVTALALAAPKRRSNRRRRRIRTRCSAGTLYDRYCARVPRHRRRRARPGRAVHWAAPRDVRRAANYKWRSTPAGQPPSDDDLRATIRFGAPGTSMPAFDARAVGDRRRSRGRDREGVRARELRRQGRRAHAARRGAGVDPARGARAVERQHGCAACHGDDGSGDGPAMKRARPYDLTALPLRRPRASDDRDARRRAAALSIATGDGRHRDAGLRAAASRRPTCGRSPIASSQLGAHAARTTRAIDPQQIDDDRAAPIATATWPGAAIPTRPRVRRRRSRRRARRRRRSRPRRRRCRARQCGRCHAKQVREWNASLHATRGVAGAARADRLHGDRRRRDVPALPRAARRASDRRSGFDAELRDEGVHVRGLSRARLDAPRAAARRRVARSPLPAYPLVDARDLRARRLLHAVSPAAAAHRGRRQAAARHVQGVARGPVHAARHAVPALPHAEPRAHVARRARSARRSARASTSRPTRSAARAATSR